MTAPMFDLTGAVAVVTGAARGIGRATAAALARQGCSVVLTDIDLDAVQEAADVIGGCAEAAWLDVTDTGALNEVITGAFRRPADLTILVNNAAVLNTDPLDMVSASAWSHTLEVNLTAAFHATRAAARATEGRAGRIVNIASLAGKQGGGFFGTTAYATSKGGLIALTKSTARELAGRGITANAVAPGPVDTAMIAEQDPARHAHLTGLVPLGRFARPEEVAAAACFLSSRESAYVTGAVVDVNGGLFMD